MTVKNTPSVCLVVGQNLKDFFSKKAVFIKKKNCCSVYYFFIYYHCGNMKL